MLRLPISVIAIVPNADGYMALLSLRSVVLHAANLSTYQESRASVNMLHLIAMTGCFAGTVAQIY
jgi:hypothetical protein